MSLAGEGAAAMWHDVRAEGWDDFYEWHNREHMPERAAIPGFLRGRRYFAVKGEPAIFSLYEADSPQTLSGTEYLNRLNNPTPWTRRAGTALFNNSRSLCRVVASHGSGQGGLIATLRYEVAEGREDEQRRLLAHRILPALADRPGICGAHLLVADRGASDVQTEEKKNRPRKALVPGWIVLVECGADAARLEAACGEMLPDQALLAAGAVAPIERGLYQLQYTRSKNARG
ncbi:MAG TPA: hypothetical protein VMK05_17385 [Burkholderiales bacterium]|nr:hypothetical protein [Burkholderiales bacterium]